MRRALSLLLGGPLVAIGGLLGLAALYIGWAGLSIVSLGDGSIAGFMDRLGSPQDQKP